LEGSVNNGQLKVLVAQWLNRGDLTDQIPTFVQFGHASLTRALAGVEEFAAPTNDSSTNWLLTAYPDTYLYAALVESAPYLRDDERVALWRAELDRRIAEVLRARTSAEINPTSYAGLQAAVRSYLDRRDLDGKVSLFIRLAHGSLVRALAGAEALADVTAGNWLLTASPDVYIYASLLEAAPYLGADERVPLWRSELDRRLAEVLRGRTSAAIDLTDYDGLVAAVKQYLDRNDLEPKVPAFVTLGEQTLRRRLKDAGTTLPALAGDGSNWLFEQAPDVYLYASLLEAAPYLGADERVPLWRMDLEMRMQDVLVSSNEVVTKRHFVSFGA
jgi:hypothetical protein